MALITHAAVKIYDLRQDKEIVIPCHRHCDAFMILKEFGYKRNVDFKELEQGFLDRNGNFLNRIDARSEAIAHNQYKPCEPEYHFTQLFSEDLW